MAALKLRVEQPKIIDVALEFLFDSHEGFTSAFTKQFGISPYRYKKDTPAISLFLPYQLIDSTIFYKRKRDTHVNQISTNFYPSYG